MLAPAERTEWREKNRDTDQERAEKRERDDGRKHTIIVEIAGSLEIFS